MPGPRQLSGAREAFDDETSTFTCRTAESVSSGMPNKVGYDITLCPEGSDFAPMRESVEQVGWGVQEFWFWGWR